MVSVRPYEIKYLKIQVHSPYREELDQLNLGPSFFFKFDDV